MGKNIFNLDNRLKVCAEKVRKGGKIVDVGTDHGYLPIWLVKNEIVSHAIAADINKEPLESAKKNIEKYQVEKIVSTILSDGLNEISETQADDIIIAGMGGELITKIISQASWLKNPQKQLILQPMSRENIVREFLNREGFSILNESTVKCKDKIYVVIVSSYTGCNYDDDILYPYVGKLLDNPSEVTFEYLHKTLKHLRNKSLSSNSEKNISKIISKLEDVLLNDNN